MTELNVTYRDSIELPETLIQANPEPSLMSPGLPSRLQQDMRTALRMATAAAHQGLHKNQVFAELLRGDLPRRDYLNLLLRLYGLHAAVERKLAPHLRSPWFAWCDWAPGEARSVRLRRDLIALGTPTSLIMTAAGADDVLPVLTTPEAALGCAWVVEGSELGGRQLARHVASIIGDTEDGSSSFFVSNPDHPGRWTACCDAVNLCGMETGRRAAILSAASATFEAIGTWLGT
jgi:heme oxygenase